MEMWKLSDLNKRRNDQTINFHVCIFLFYVGCALQVDSGFFLDCDVKIVGKSIRDRVALIKWRRERTVSSGNGEAPPKKAPQNLLCVPGGEATRPVPSLISDSEELEAEQQRPTPVGTVPVAVSSTCECPPPPLRCVLVLGGPSPPTLSLDWKCV